MFKKEGLYYPDKKFKRNALLKNKKVYQKVNKNPIKFWEKLAKEIFWFKKWKKGFIHKPPYFQWFKNGKINITENIFEKNKLGWEKIKNKIALIWEPEPVEEKPKVLSYQELLKIVNKFANALKKLKIKKGDRVGIYLPMIPEAIISILACAKIGAIHCVVFSAFSSIALKTRLKDAQVKILITADGYYRKGKIINLKILADEGIKKTKVEKIIVVKRLGKEIPWDKNRDLWFEEIIKNEKEECKSEIMDSEDLLFLLATSGSTDKPKQIIHTCGGYTVQAYWTGKWVFDWKKNDIFWCTADIGWITGHSYTCYSPLLNGITTIIFEGALNWPNSERWAQIIEKYKVTIFYTSPTVIRMLIKEVGSLKKYKFKKLRLLGSVGEPIDESTWIWYFKEIGKKKCLIVDTWWQTETGGILISSLPGIGPFKPTFSGLPFPGIKFDILDNKGKTLSSEKKGNLVILPPFAPGMFRGIYKNSKKYKKIYWSQYNNKIYFTGDIAYQDKNGLIKIEGRVDDVIKVAGHRLSSGEFESILNLHPDIIECAVISAPDKIKGEAIIIFIVSSKKYKDINQLKEEVIKQIKKEIGSIALPKEIYLIEDLPRTRSGKIMRRIVKKLFLKEDIGDLSTLINPESIQKIRKII